MSPGMGGAGSRVQGPAQVIRCNPFSHPSQQCLPEASSHVPPPATCPLSWLISSSLFPSFLKPPPTLTVRSSSAFSSLASAPHPQPHRTQVGGLSCCPLGPLTLPHPSQVGLTEATLEEEADEGVDFPQRPLYPKVTEPARYLSSSQGSWTKGHSRRAATWGCGPEPRKRPLLCLYYRNCGLLMSS